MKILLIILVIGTTFSCGESKEEKFKRTQDSLSDLVAAYDRLRDARAVNFEQRERLLTSYGNLRIAYLGKSGKSEQWKDSINVRFDYVRDSVNRAFDSLLALDSVRIFRGGK